MSRSVGRPAGDSRRRRPAAMLLAAAVFLAAVTFATALAFGAPSLEVPAGARSATAAEGADADVAGPAPQAVTTSEVPLGRYVASESVSGSAPTARSEPLAAVAPSPTAATAPPQDPADPPVVARPVPSATPSEAPPPAPTPSWASSTTITPAGHVSTDVGCLPSGDGPPTAAELDEFLAGRVGPVIGWDYQHVYPLGGDRFLWLFQDAFVDHSGGAATLAQAGFAHNVALVQQGRCFRLLHRGSAARPAPFEPGTGSSTLGTWFWPMGGELHGGELHVFWVQMVKDGYDPEPPDGLGWHPVETWVATYDPGTMERLAFRRPANAGVTPIYGYAVASDETYTYLFGNSFEQNLAREGGYWSGRHSATRILLARVPRGRLLDTPEYRTATGWSRDPTSAVAVLDRHWAEFPFQPRFVDGQWVGVAAIDGYWGDAFSVDVALQPWGPWTTVESRPLAPRGGDPMMNTYHAHLAPWRDRAGNLVVTVSNNARDMRRDAWPHPHRYRPTAFAAAFVPAPPTGSSPVPTSTTSTTSSSTSTSSSSTSTTSSTTSSTTLPATSVPPDGPPSSVNPSVPAPGWPSTSSLPQR